MSEHGATPVEIPISQSVPIVIREPEKSSSFLAWPSPKHLVAWLGLLAAVIAVAAPLVGAFFVKNTIYDTDKNAQQQVNAKVDKESTVIQVHLDALKQQLDTHTADSAKQNDQINHKLDDLLNRRR